MIEAQVHEYYGKISSAARRPLSVTEVPESGFFAPGPNDPSAARGNLRVYVCRSCGYAQWFAVAAAEIPIGEAHGTRLIRGPARSHP